MIIKSPLPVNIVKETCSAHPKVHSITFTVAALTVKQDMSTQVGALQNYGY